MFLRGLGGPGLRESSNSTRLPTASLEVQTVEILPLPGALSLGHASLRTGTSRLILGSPVPTLGSLGSRLLLLAWLCGEAEDPFPKPLVPLTYTHKEP